MKHPRLSQTLKISLLATAMLATALATAAHGDDCSPIRLDETVTQADGTVVEGSMVHVAVRNQHAIGSCYAHASSQMFDAWRYRHGENDRESYKDFSSGFEIGQRFKVEGNREIENDSELFGRLDRIGQSVDKDINGGFVKRLLPFLLSDGTCSQRKLNAIFKKETHLDVDLYASAIMGMLGRRRSDLHIAETAIIEKYFPVAPKPELTDSHGLLLNSALPPAAIDHTYVANELVRNIERRDLQRLQEMAQKEIDALHAKTLADGIAELKEYNARVLVDATPKIDYHALAIEAMKWTPNDVNTVKMFEIISVIGCNGHEIHTRGKYEVDGTSTYLGIIKFLGKKNPTYKADKFRAAVNAELNKGLEAAYPIAISYCSKVLGAGREFASQPWSDDTKCARHASLIIGRRPDPSSAGRCQYLIRNSWGREISCNAYHSDWTCDGPKGSVWVDADALGRAVHDVETMRTIED
jgi:hypothetical protein